MFYLIEETATYKRYCVVNAEGLPKKKKPSDLVDSSVSIELPGGLVCIGNISYKETIVDITNPDRAVRNAIVGLSSIDVLEPKFVDTKQYGKTKVESKVTKPSKSSKKAELLELAALLKD